jgi:hypothetical protein
MFLLAVVVGLLKVPNRADDPKIPTACGRAILRRMAMPDGSSGPKWTALFEKVVEDDMVFKLGGDTHARALP